MGCPSAALALPRLRWGGAPRGAKQKHRPAWDRKAALIPAENYIGGDDVVIVIW